MPRGFTRRDGRYGYGLGYPILRGGLARAKYICRKCGGKTATRLESELCFRCMSAEVLARAIVNSHDLERDAGGQYSCPRCRRHFPSLEAVAGQPSCDQFLEAAKGSPAMNDER